ncbi:chalcone isomerase family protein [Aliiglaciecola sp. 3_MG-2023]|uniref:chalcone isomerase family protein n=1 Tax=Aliiglaciecola sp. 3_MG-2023 TaxID=3062644 RepID=UPI0026E17B76|nr:chalcone isomerase family protein [Aliiglaciecola sp. 3_MG-2023]MDO6693953.1 chalcone isomerase family protein [Aliiglaciecola sp. 3_MG-2023]
MANPIADLSKVGSAKLEVFFFDIYFSTLYSKSGKYSEDELPLALQIKYLRAIKSEDLLNRTKQEWQKLGFSSQDVENWLQTLDSIWPNINKHDVLTLKVGSNGHSEFFFNDAPIGVIEDQKFGPSFLAIWLDEKCSYPKLRKQLIGS